MKSKYIQRKRHVTKVANRKATVTQQSFMQRLLKKLDPEKPGAIFN